MKILGDFKKAKLLFQNILKCLFSTCSFVDIDKISICIVLFFSLSSLATFAFRLSIISKELPSKYVLPNLKRLSYFRSTTCNITNLHRQRKEACHLISYPNPTYLSRSYLFMRYAIH